MPSPFTICDVTPDGAAHRSGSFRLGDLVHAVSGQSIEHLELKQVLMVCVSALVALNSVGLLRLRHEGTMQR